ncbi:hypothetical protein G6F57_003055 [Rhizopus arrhizus]|uniref:Yeast cell wall synthesis Kre9/Knh1-like N-terminal domain-containing protein n=1 Tax=Rhizopus oryzae TaxID=64495 RepID=A0A9P7BVM5_RHIOR|nr:hypothetical protein G6F23_000186 [Rhizopus arrhizus]KAG1428032.1 hypothetical protein G6F58_000746 [Rhizopus delemar]KAG0767506.1 hypothetical protein G6F24_002734 [Rhizopus arrhizus]KAG0785451.1 hypothetical protein G6F22_007953 [Rhizopus arrhizus]KAG0796932.1 hypothetical protein G6F21_000918 [Rhizopus arrhizus]
MKSIVAAIAAFAITMASAQTTNIVSPHAPTLGQVVTAGQSTTITWTPIAGFDTISSIDLLKGDASALTPVTGGHVANNIKSSVGSYTWNVPASLATGTDYALSFGTSPNVSYTPFFTIKSSNAASGNSSSASSGSSSNASSSSANSSPANSSPAAASKGSSSSSTASSAAASTTKAASAANKNAAAVGAIAVVGAAVAALV